MKVYVAALNKLSTLRPGCFDNLWTPGGVIGKWVVFGHFDTLQVYELNIGRKNLFKAIHENNLEITRHINDEKYIYPMYLISEGDDGSFWNCHESFFAVVRIHFASNMNVNEEYDNLVKLINDEPSKKCRCSFYRTVELSDMILAVKSEKLQDLIGFTLTLQKYDVVGKVYTYCGISYENLKDATWEPGSDDRIDFFSIRFSMAQAEYYEEQINLIMKSLTAKNPYSIMGVDDFALVERELSVKNLVKLHRSWFLGVERDEKDFGKGISDVTTRIGINLERLGKNERREVELERNKLQNACRMLGKKYKDLSTQKEFYKNYQWDTALAGLIDGLTRMSRSAVLDEFVYLMYSSVYSFLNKLEKTTANSEIDNQVCYDFIENWTHLMEHIMRIEGELSYYPDVRSVLYDIPLAMLEYILAFLSEVAEILQTNDSHKMEINFLIVPRLCERIVAQEMVVANYDVPGLVLITLPLKDLYNPYSVQMELCHEVSHFAGEKYRNRSLRLDKFIKSASALISWELFGTTNNLFLKAVQEELKQQMNMLEVHHIRLMKRKAVEWLINFYRDPSKKNGFIRDVAREISIHKGKVHVDLKRFDIDEAIITRCEMLLEDLSTLYREIYADVCMLLLLDIKIDVYIDRILLELERDNRDEEHKPYEQFAIRVYIALLVTGNNIPQGINSLFSEELKLINQTLMDDEFDERINDNRLIPMEAIKYLLEYAEKCAKDIRIGIGTDELIIRQMFTNVSSDAVNYRKFLDDINSYRQKVLNRYT